MRLLKRYVLKKFLAVYALTLISLISVFLLVDFFERVDEFLVKGSTLFDLFAYYFYKIPFILFFIALLILFTDQFTNFFKDSFQRLRPCRAEYLNLRQIDIYCGKYGFFSAHASNSIAVSLFLIRVMKERFSSLFSIFLFLWVFIFSYSRIYLGLHYPVDILFGLLFGAISSSIFYTIYLRINNYFLDKI